MNPKIIKLNRDFFTECPDFQTFLAQVRISRDLQGARDRMTDDDLMAKTWLYYSNADEVAPALIGEPGITTLAEASNAVLRQLRRRLVNEFGSEYLNFLKLTAQTT